MIKKPKSVEFNKAAKEVIIKEERRVKVESANDVKEAKQILEAELRGIIGQVKSLKKRAFEIKGLLAEIEELSEGEKAGPVKDPA